MGKALCQEVWIKAAACGFNPEAYTKLFSKCNLGNIIILIPCGILPLPSVSCLQVLCTGLGPSQNHAEVLAPVLLKAWQIMLCGCSSSDGIMLVLMSCISSVTGVAVKGETWDWREALWLKAAIAEDPSLVPSTYISDS